MKHTNPTNKNMSGLFRRQIIDQNKKMLLRREKNQFWCEIRFLFAGLLIGAIISLIFK